VALWVREVHWLRLDQLVHLRVVAVARVEWGEANNHFVGEDTDSPPVNWERMTFLDKNFGRQIIRRSAEGESLLASFENLRETEVSQTNVAIFVHKNVFWLQVTVDNLLVVEVTNSHGYLDSVEFSAFFSKSLCLPQVHEKFSASNESHNEKDLLVCHEDIVHTDEEGVVGLQKNIFLKLGRLNLVVIEDNILT
jgi:hypothetical protein